MPHEPDDLIPTRWTLINRLKDWDDQESWREFFDLYWRLIYNVALKLDLAPEEAEDVVQETIISVCKNIKNFKADPAFGSFKSWLFKLTRWRIIDRIRKRPLEQLQPAQQVYLNSKDTSATTATQVQIPDPSANALDQIWESEWQSNVLSSALEKLERQVSAKHYQIFYLHVIKQHPVEQVARVAGVKSDQVYLIKHRLAPLLKSAVEELETKMK